MFKIDKNIISANVPRTIRFSELLFEQLKQVAKQNDISFNRLVLECCMYALDNLEEQE